jgi:hypothetical protein
VLLLFIPWGHRHIYKRRDFRMEQFDKCINDIEGIVGEIVVCMETWYLSEHFTFLESHGVEIIPRNGNMSRSRVREYFQGENVACYAGYFTPETILAIHTREEVRLGVGNSETG